MSIVVGEIHKGEVTGITNFGAFIKLANGETGLCHISEVSSDYVKDVNNHLTKGQEVEVKVIKIEDGKLSLSIKACQEQKAMNREDSKYMKPKKKPKQSKDFEKMLSNFIDNAPDSVQKSSRSNKKKRNGYK